MHATTNYKTNSFPKYKYNILFEKLNVKSLLYMLDLPNKPDKPCFGATFQRAIIILGH
jgi:hypothetical protein